MNSNRKSNSAPLRPVLSPGPGCWVFAFLFLMLGFGGNLTAAEKSFILGGVPVTLQDITSDVEVRYQSMRLNRALNVWNVEATLTNKSSRPLRGPFVLQIESLDHLALPARILLEFCGPRFIQIITRLTSEGVTPEIRDA